MTTLQLLVSKPAAQLAARLGAPLTPHGQQRTASTSAEFDNRPTWDNWTKHR